MLDLGTQVLSRCLFPASTRSRDSHRLLRGRWRRVDRAVRRLRRAGVNTSHPLWQCPPPRLRSPSLPPPWPGLPQLPPRRRPFSPSPWPDIYTTLLRTPSPLPPSMGPDVSHNSPSHTTSPSLPLSMAPNVYHKSPLPRASAGGAGRAVAAHYAGGSSPPFISEDPETRAQRGARQPQGPPPAIVPPNHSGVRRRRGAAGAAGDARPRRDPPKRLTGWPNTTSQESSSRMTPGSSTPTPPSPKPTCATKSSTRTPAPAAPLWWSTGDHERSITSRPKSARSSAPSNRPRRPRRPLLLRPLRRR